MAIGVEIKLSKLLKKHNMSKRELAEKADLSYNGIINFANNNTDRVYFDTLEKICTVLNCKISDILELK